MYWLVCITGTDVVVQNFLFEKVSLVRLTSASSCETYLLLYQLIYDVTSMAERSEACHGAVILSLTFSTPANQQCDLKFASKFVNIKVITL